MAKNTFFIRASVNTGHGGAFAETEIDLGSYTNLGSSKPEVLRIHNINIAITSAGGSIPTFGANLADYVMWQLCTTSQTAMIVPSEQTYISGGQAGWRNPDGTPNPPSQELGALILPQDWTDGVVVAVPSLFLGGWGPTDATEDVYYSVIMECTTEPMSKPNAVSLAISQQ